MIDVDKVKEMMDAEKYIEELKARKNKLEKEFVEIKESLGEQLDDLKETGHEVKLWIKSNKIIAFGAVGIFFLGIALGALSSVL